jgi:hypothetical protein
MSGLEILAVIGFVTYQQDGSTFLGGAFSGQGRSGRY